MAAIRFPRDYAGIVATAPAGSMTGRMLQGIHRTKLQMAAGAWVPPAKVRVIRDEVLRQCDGLDGLADGVVHNYVDCSLRFDPTVTPNPLARIRCASGADTESNCLSDAQIATVNSIRAPFEIGFPLAGGESVVPGFTVGQEILVNVSFESDGSFPFLQRPPTTVGAAQLGDRYPATKFDFMHQPMSAYREQILAYSEAVDEPTDWSALLASPTKLIIRVAASDQVVHARATMQLYETAVRRHGQAAIDKSVRFYVTPNAEHGIRGFSATTGKALPRYADLMGAVVSWAETGKAPDSLRETLEEERPPYTVLRSRPLCRYPQYPHYTGSGSPDAMNSYRCTMPKLGSGVSRRSTD
jgi:feruloyl esterase